MPSRAELGAEASAPRLSFFNSPVTGGRRLLRRPRYFHRRAGVRTAAACRRYTHRSCAICFIACHPHTGVCVRLKSRWPYHRAEGAPPMAEAMDGKEEIRVVEEQPAWQAGSLESRRHRQGAGQSVKLAADQ